MDEIIRIQRAYEDAIATRDYRAINRLRAERDWALDDALVHFVDAKPRAAYFAPRQPDRPGRGLPPRR